MIIPEDIAQQSEIPRIEISEFYANKRLIGLSTIIQELANNCTNGNPIWSYYSRDHQMVYSNSKKLRLTDMEDAWHLSNPDAEKVFKALRAAGVKLAVVSNFDTQLKPVLRALNCDYWFDAVAVSAEVAWHLCDPDSEKVFKALRAAGVKLAVVSNFDTQLRPVLRALNCDHWFDAVVVSTEVEAEKPNPTIFLKACELLEVNPDDVVHSSQPCWTCFFSEATKHKDGGPLDKEFSNTIVGQSYICPKFEDFDSVLYLKLQEELFFEIKNLKYKGESLCTGKPIALSYLHCWLVTKCWCDLFR
ncbi:hypothetical protein P3S67_012797 [Capsicum chacoense]